MGSNLVEAWFFSQVVLLSALIVVIIFIFHPQVTCMNNSSIYPQGYQFLLWKRDYRYIQCWTLPSYSFSCKEACDPISVFYVVWPSELFEFEIWQGSFLCYFFLLNKNISHRFDELVAIVWRECGYVPTRVGVIMSSSSTKPNSGVTGMAVVLFVTNDTNSCFRTTTHDVEPFLVTSGL